MIVNPVSVRKYQERGEELMKKALLAAAAIVALPVAAQAQAPQPGLYIGAEGGINWLTNFTANTNIPAFPTVSVFWMSAATANPS